MNWDDKFKTQYDYSRAWLADNRAFDPAWRELATQLYELMALDGFDANRAKALDELRRRMSAAFDSAKPGKRGDESETLLRAVGGVSDAPGAVITDEAKMRAAALKMLRHVYLLNKSGNRKVWIHSLPVDYLHWAYLYLHGYCGTNQAVRTALGTREEHFSREQKKYLAVSTQQALAWSHRALIVLAQAASGTMTPTASASAARSPARRDDARALVRRWFADPAVSEADLDTYISVLSRGFKAMIACLNRGQFVLTDWVPLRGASTDEELRFLNSEAFTFARRNEGMDVVYIEKAFFEDRPGSVLHGQKNWTRVMLHELSHLVCGTQDIHIGQARYAWYGIGPHAGYPGPAAVRNADNWAFFGADCAGALTDGERAMALRIV
jgi:hypothetical protein